MVNQNLLFIFINNFCLPEIFIVQDELKLYTD